MAWDGDASFARLVCPICFEAPTSCWRTQKAWYKDVDNHSWNNREKCDAHDICWSCLARHIEVQVLSEGKCTVRCPGESCGYHLLADDIHFALWGSPAQDEVIDTLARLSSQSCQGRLKDIAFGNLANDSDEWFTQQCQPCPQCFVLARRETGCNHIVCRCGCDFCFACGAPNYGHEEAGCICGMLDHSSKHGQVFFAAWLRTASTSPCTWLRECEKADLKVMRFVGTLGFWLWMAGAKISPPDSWDGDIERIVLPPERDSQIVLPPLKWKPRGDWYTPDDDENWYVPDDDEMSDYDFDMYEERPCGLEQDLAGHLRKELYSDFSHRALRRDAQRGSKVSPNGEELDECCDRGKVLAACRSQRLKATKQRRDGKILFAEL